MSVLQRDAVGQGESSSESETAVQTVAPQETPPEAGGEVEAGAPTMRSAEAMYAEHMAALRDVQQQLMELSVLGGALSPEVGGMFGALCVELAQATLNPALMKAELARRQDPGLGGFARGLGQLQYAWEQIQGTLAQLGALAVGGDSEVLRAKVEALQGRCGPELMAIVMDAAALPKMARERTDLEIVQRLQQALLSAEVGEAP